jgi:hypothetical protein
MTTYETELKEFSESDKRAKDLLTGFHNGDILRDLVPDVEEVREAYLERIETLRSAVEARNSAAKQLADKLRGAVVAPEGENRGPDAQPTKLKVGSMSVSSVTSRTFDLSILERGLRDMGVWEAVSQVQTVNPKSGEPEPVIRTTMEVNYAAMRTYLMAYANSCLVAENNTEASREDREAAKVRRGQILKLLEDAYVEREKTATVTGLPMLVLPGGVDR